jgi:hypothetical protein
MLKSIEDELGGHLRIQNFFDLIVGTRYVDRLPLPLDIRRKDVGQRHPLYVSRTAAKLATAREASLLWDLVSMGGVCQNAFSASKLYAERLSPAGDGQVFAELPR